LDGIVEEFAATPTNARRDCLIIELKKCILTWQTDAFMSNFWGLSKITAENFTALQRQIRRISGVGKAAFRAFS
jgi:hypothetical protein